jgi:hypothetical protein
MLLNYKILILKIQEAVNIVKDNRLHRLQYILITDEYLSLWHYKWATGIYQGGDK